MRQAVVLDSSALLALFQAEPGAEKVSGRIDGASISAVNWSEVLQVAARKGLPADFIQTRVLQFGLVVVPFGVEDAAPTAELAQGKGGAALSLGDRACLALAQRLGATAVTADRAWLAVKGVKVESIR